MKTCERFTKLLSDYAENALTPAEKSELDVHLQKCTECRSAANGVVNLRRNLRHLSTVQISPDFETILRTRIKLDRRAYAAPMWNTHYVAPRRIVTYSATAVIMISCMFYLWQRFSAKALPPSSTIAVSKMQLAPSSTLPSVTPAKILYTLDQVTPQLWPNFGASGAESDRAVSVADTLRVDSPPLQPAPTPVSHQPITF
jgi:predicted anti-sigma-YlaC factor YlaD